MMMRRTVSTTIGSSSVPKARSHTHTHTQPTKNNVTYDHTNECRLCGTRNSLGLQKNQNKHQGTKKINNRFAVTSVKTISTHIYYTTSDLHHRFSRTGWAVQ